MLSSILNPQSFTISVYLWLLVLGACFFSRVGSDMITFPERFNMAEYFLDHNLAAGRGGKVCLRFGDERLTYDEVARQANRAGHLLRELGTSIEDRVLFIL